MSRLNKEREKELQPKRIEYATKKLNMLGISDLYVDNTKIVFDHKGSKVILYPYSGWHTGKTIKDGRGIDKLIEQLKQTER